MKYHRSWKRRYKRCWEPAKNRTPGATAQPKYVSSPIPSTPGVRSSCKPPASSKITIPSVCPSARGPEIDETRDRSGSGHPLQRGYKGPGGMSPHQVRGQGRGQVPKARGEHHGPSSAQDCTLGQQRPACNLHQWDDPMFEATSYLIRAWDMRLLLESCL